jgi:hypothetical protein
MYSESGIATPMVGTKVMTADGEELGKVKETMGGCFKVDAPMQPDYWLGTDCIRDSTGGIVRLSFRKDELGDRKEDGPDDKMTEHKGYHRHM